MEIKRILSGSPVEVGTAIINYRTGNEGIFGGSTPFELFPDTPRTEARNLIEVLLDKYDPEPIPPDASLVRFKMDYHYTVKIPARVYGGDSDHYVGAIKTGYITIHKLPDNNAQIIVRAGDEDWPELKTLWEPLVDYLAELGFVKMTQPQTFEELIESLPGEPGSKLWWERLNDAYNNDSILERINITQERVSEKTGIPLRTVKRKLEKNA